jgi:hypothetical protein
MDQAEDENMIQIQGQPANRFGVALRRLEMLRTEHLRLLAHIAVLQENVENLRAERDTLEAAILVDAGATGRK